MLAISKQKIYSLIVAAFFISVAIAQFAYVQSTFLNKYFSLEYISLIFFSAYLITFFAINNYSNVIARFSNFKTTIILLLAHILTFLIFIYSANCWLIYLGFVIYIISNNLLLINFDIFLENYTSTQETGRVRGLYYTISNLGWVISPIITGLILEKSGFNLLFCIIIILMLPIILILTWQFRNHHNQFSNRRFKMTSSIKKIVQHPDLEKIFYIAFLLQFFYAIMVIYTPLYLNQVIGFNWEEIGLIFTIMLLPFILLEYPAGYLADKYLGEKELLTIGLAITAITPFIIFITPNTSLLFWAILLFISRIGASLIEIMRETYFFKKVNIANLDLINAFRSTLPLAYIVVPLLAAGVLYFLTINYLFLILSAVMLTGLYFSLTLKDTK